MRPYFDYMSLVPDHGFKRGLPFRINQASNSSISSMVIDFGSSSNSDSPNFLFLSCNTRIFSFNGISGQKPLCRYRPNLPNPVCPGNRLIFQWLIPPGIQNKDHSRQPLNSSPTLRLNGHKECQNVWVPLETGLLWRDRAWKCFHLARHRGVC